MRLALDPQAAIIGPVRSAITAPLRLALDPQAAIIVEADDVAQQLLRLALDPQAAIIRRRSRQGQHGCGWPSIPKRL